ncbi:MAG: biotin transporter BioY, partial [Actinobacteria bacterium]|nr:biotin transporter BioY [Actinomycetota bacterium]
PAMLLGSAIVYALGSAWLSIDLGVPLATGERNAISLGVAPFLVGDAIKAVAAAACTSGAWAAIGGRADRGA